MSLDKLEEQGLLLPEPASRKEIARLYDAMERRLKDASIEVTSNEARAEHLYHVVLQCANAALRANDYRLQSTEGAHIITLDTLEFTLGTDPVSIKFFQKLRARRNADLYRGEDRVSDSQLFTMTEKVTELHRTTLAYIASLRSDLIT